VATHAVRHTDCSLETHSFFSHHLGDTPLSLFVIYSRHTTSSLHGDTRRLIRHTDPSRHTGNCCCCLETDSTSLPDTQGNCSSSYQFVSATHASSTTHAGIGTQPEFTRSLTYSCCCGLFIDEVFVFLLLLGDPVHSHGLH